MLPDKETVCPKDGASLQLLNTPSAKTAILGSSAGPEAIPPAFAPTVTPQAAEPSAPQTTAATGAAPAVENVAPPAAGAAERPPASLVGTILEGRYRIIRQLGEGGMGVVYEGEHVAIEKRFAIKVLKEEVSGQSEVVARFRQEARSASRIGHPNIVDVTDFGETPNGQAFFVMELMDGHDLALLLAREKALPVQRAVAIIRQVLKALDAAHKQGIVHRDMKPENIFLAKRGGEEVAKILDFGIAKITGTAKKGQRLTQAGMIFGTPTYMSPEQAQGKDPDNGTDIYSVGVILWEMLAGRPPFTGENYMDVLSQHVFAQPPPLNEANPGISIPPGLEQVVLRAMAKERWARYQTAGEMLADIEKTLRSEPLGQPAPAPVVKEPPTTRKVLVPQVKKGLPVVLVAGLSTVVVILIAGVIGWWLFNPSGKEGERSGSRPTFINTFKQMVSPGKKPSDQAQSQDAAAGKPAQAEPPQGRMVSVSILTDPAGATVLLPDVGVLCLRTPCNVKLPEGKRSVLAITKGEMRTQLEVVPQGTSQVIEAKLKPESASSSSKAKGRRPKHRPSHSPRSSDDLKVPKGF